MTQLLDYIVKMEKEIEKLRSYREPQPMKVVKSDSEKVEYKCPRCGTVYVAYFPIDYMYKFCPKCGQALECNGVESKEWR